VNLFNTFLKSPNCSNTVLQASYSILLVRLQPSQWYHHYPFFRFLSIFNILSAPLNVPLFLFGSIKYKNKFSQKNLFYVFIILKIKHSMSKLLAFLGAILMAHAAISVGQFRGIMKERGDADASIPLDIIIEVHFHRENLTVR
jgi:hypothetical protein